MGISRRSMAKTALGGAAAIAALSEALPALADEDTPADAVEAFRKAMMANDHAAFDLLCAAQLSYGHSNGKIQTKAEFITDVASRSATWKTLEFANARNTVAGMNAISRFTLNGEVESDGSLKPVAIGVLMVWQRQGNDWKLLARQGFKT